jgi:hypothetical protein
VRAPSEDSEKGLVTLLKAYQIGREFEPIAIGQMAFCGSRSIPSKIAHCFEQPSGKI